MSKKIARYAMLTALAITFSYIESFLIIPLPIPGIKLGLANIVVLIALYSMGFGAAFMISILRVFVTAITFSGFSSLMFSLGGSILSLAAMYLCKKSRLFSVTGVSITGGIAHNLGQIIVAALVVSNLKLFYYLPVLIVSGGLTGLIIGISSSTVLRHLKTAENETNLKSSD